MSDRGSRITSAWAFIVVDDDGDESIPAVLGGPPPEEGRADVGPMWLPLIGADPERVAQLRGVVEEFAKAEGKRVELVRFTSRCHIDWIEP